MAQACLLLAVTTLTLLAGSLWPRQGETTLVAIPAGVSAIAAFTAPGWRVQRITQHAGITLLIAAPDSSDSQPSRLSDAAQGWLVLRAVSRPRCTRS